MVSSSNLTILEITRAKAYIAMAIPHKVYVDEQKSGEVQNGKTQTFEVSPGQHTVYVKQSMWVQSNSLSLDCSPNQTIRLQVKQNSALSQILLALIPFGGLILKKRDNLTLERIE